MFLGETCFAAEGYDKVASDADTAGQRSVSQYGMVPIRGMDVEDGIYPIEVRSSSRFFRVEEARLTVKRGEMTADVTMYSASYRFVYPGTAQAAAGAASKDYIPLQDSEGQGHFQMTVSGLDEEIPCAAFSKKKKMWYDRTILFDASTLPDGALKINLPDYDRIEKALQGLEAGQGTGENGTGTGDTGGEAGANAIAGTAWDADKASGTEEGAGDTGATGGRAAGRTLASDEPVDLDLADGTYSIQVDMTGGSGRASVTSPTWLMVKEGKAYARLLWSSTYYDYMIVGGTRYDNETTDGGNSTFTIPIAVMDEPMPVIADTTAMGDPVEIAYALTFYGDSIGSKNQIPQEATIHVLIVALVIIAAGGVLNFIIKRRRKQ